jgi:hypothetical protein
MMMKYYRELRVVARFALSLCVVGAGGIVHAADAGGKSASKRLQIVFMFGQSEMVGKAAVPTATYMLRKPVVPPREVTLNAHKAMPHQINGAYLYWQAMNAYAGPEKKKQELKALIEKRSIFKEEFKQHVLDELAKNNGTFRGKKYSGRRGFWLYNLCDEEAEKVGITPKIRAILDVPDNPFKVDTAYDALVRGGELRYAKQMKLNKLFLNGTTPEDFAGFAEAAKQLEAEAQAKGSTLSPEKHRLAYAKLAETHLHMPIAKRTHIYGLGTLAGTPDADAGNVTSGRLSVGYGSNIQSIGLEYAVGITLEQQLDAPILIVKCAWDNGRASIDQLWCPTTPEGENPPQPAWALERILPRLQAILSDPKKYHPDYDPAVGFDVAGMIWFQGLSDKQNPNYARHLEAMLRDFRTAVKSPSMPVVCATVGTMMFQTESDTSLVNQAMREVASKPEFKGTTDVVETYVSYPAELAVLNSLFHKRKLNDKSLLDVVHTASGARGKRSPPYLGSASFYLLAGNEVATSLAKMINGEKPVVPIR